MITRIKFLVHGMGQHCFKPKKQFVFANDYGRTNWFRVIFLQLKKGCQGP